MENPGGKPPGFFLEQWYSENRMAVAEHEGEPCDSIAANLFTYLSY
jgi:hypothetical protein